MNSKRPNCVTIRYQVTKTRNSFGFEDGISNPVVKDLGEDLSGQGPVDQGYCCHSSLIYPSNSYPGVAK